VSPISQQVADTACPNVAAKEARKGEMRIIDLTPDTDEAIRQVAAMLVDQLPLGWPTLTQAFEEVRESFKEGRISRLAVEDDTVLGS
jgi:hypothetical protein